eukprot:IDg13461t1
MSYEEPMRRIQICDEACKIALQFTFEGQHVCDPPAAINCLKRTQRAKYSLHSLQEMQCKLRLGSAAYTQ